jgi:hypothetical protein
MSENHHIVDYNVKFNRLAIQTGWDDSVLRHRYYSGLSDRIKDIMGQQGKPSTLSAMKSLAHSIDSRHWERLHEKSRSDIDIYAKPTSQPSSNNISDSEISDANISDSDNSDSEISDSNISDSEISDSNNSDPKISDSEQSKAATENSEIDDSDSDSE